MSEDSWAVAVDVQEATIPSIQVAFNFKGGRELKKVQSNSLTHRSLAG